MHKFILITAACLAALVLSIETAASASVNLRRISRQDLGSVCMKTGASLRRHGVVDVCVKMNCDHKGGSCGVTCPLLGDCTGSTPGLEAGEKQYFDTGPAGAVEVLMNAPLTPIVRDHRKKPIVRDHRTKPIVRDHRKIECLGNLC